MPPRLLPQEVRTVQGEEQGDDVGERPTHLIERAAGGIGLHDHPSGTTGLPGAGEEQVEFNVS